MRRMGWILVFVTGCMGSASIYYQDRGGGVLALHHDEDRAMKDAREKMAAHCGAAGYQVVKRETVVIGQESYANSQRSYGEDQVSTHAKDTTAMSHSEVGYQAGSATDVQHVEDTAETVTGHVSGSETHVTHGAAGQSEMAMNEASSTRATRETNVRGGEATSSVSGTREVSEIRVTYMCGTGAAAAEPR